ncbi:MAG: D-Ala-D-Ala carboxypeptidase family metallohydrolase [Actinomycetota bacterium]
MDRPILKCLAGALALVILSSAAPASAARFSRSLTRGAEGPDVKELQVRVAGWFPNARQERLRIGGRFNWKTERALKTFQRAERLTVDGVAGPEVYEALKRLADGDDSTKHFDWSEFDQNYNSRCSAKANKYAGTFKGGPLPRVKVRENVRRLMWRLEALRARGHGKPIGINSGFRSTPYNKCIGGASLSQHLYGNAADLRVVGANNRRTRDLARSGQFYGVGCYSVFTHNHLDLRLENHDLGAAQYWWWPEQDSRGRDLADDGRPCWGEVASKRAAAGMLNALRASDPAGASVVPTLEEVARFKAQAEPFFHGLAD